MHTMILITYRALANIVLIVFGGVLFFSPALAAEQQFMLKITQRQIEKKPPTLRVKQGDKLELKWGTDETVKLHLHGYDLSLTLKPGNDSQSTQKMIFTAHIAGRFALSAHGFGADLGAKHPHEVPLLYLEVQPQ